MVLCKQNIDSSRLWISIVNKHCLKGAIHKHFYCSLFMKSFFLRKFTRNKLFIVSLIIIYSVVYKLNIEMEDSTESKT